MKLSVLDVLPITSGSNAGDSLRRAVDLARASDSLGFERLWYAEHHGLGSIASSVPELLIAHVGTATERIRLGAGGVMLPNHVPLRVVEQYRTLNALHPGRIDLGIGRAAGTDPLTARALRSTAGQEFGHELAELLAFANAGFPDDHPFRRVGVTPDGVPLPPIWMLGSSGGSAQLAGQLGLGYGFAGHFAPAPAGPAVASYRRAFQPSEAFPEPHVILAVNVVCAETDEEAERLSSSMQMTIADMATTGQPGPLRTPEEAERDGWRPGLRKLLGPMGQKMIVGSPKSVAAQVQHAVGAAGGADEVMIMTLVHDPAARLRSYELVMAELG